MTDFHLVENGHILARRQRFAWTVNGHENPTVPCVDCGSLEMKIVMAEVTPTGVHVELECRRCHRFAMHLGIDERPLHLGSSYVTVTTD